MNLYLKGDFWHFAKACHSETGVFANRRISAEKSGGSSRPSEELIAIYPARWAWSW